MNTKSMLAKEVAGAKRSMLKLPKAALQRHCIENWKQIFPEKELCGLSPNFHIHVSVSDLYIPRSVCICCCRKICGLILGIYKTLTDT
jgi:hypothetical protein